MSSSVGSRPTVNDHKSASPARYLDTTAAYDRWSEVYDTDGNFLQALDTIEMQSLLPRLLLQISTSSPCKIVDLGCGTGRNTLPLLSLAWSTVIGLDASPKMLNIARSRTEASLSELPPEKRAARVDLHVFDMLQDQAIPVCATEADAVISTLVLEHVPVATFFKTASRMLRPGGVLLLTNMHSEMGRLSQAGFVDPKTGEKIRPKSYAHRVADVIKEAENVGLDVIGDVLERAVDEETSMLLGPRARKWVGVTVWFSICFRLRV